MLYSTSVGLSSAMYPHGPTEKVLKGFLIVRMDLLSTFLKGYFKLKLF